jgi:O-antigen/teichoic acid export membrane protein
MTTSGRSSHGYDGTKGRILQAWLPWLRLLFVRAAGLPLALAANVIIGRLLGPGAYGAYAMYLSVALVGASFGVLGADKVMVRELGRTTDAARPGELKRLLPWLARAYAMSLSSVLLLFIFWLGAVWWQGGAVAPVLGALAVVPFYGGTMLAAGILAGFNRVEVAQSLDNVIKNVVLLAGAVGASVWQMRGIVPLLGLQAVAFAVAMSIGLGSLAWRLRGSLTGDAAEGIGAPQGWLMQKSSIVFFMGGAATSLIARFDVILVSIFGTAYQTGLFGAANRFAQLGSVVALAMMYKLQPVFSRAALMTVQELELGLARARRTSFGLTLVAISFGLAFPRLIIGAMGAAFLPAAPVFQVLLLGYLANSLVTPDYAFLTMSGHETFVARIAWAQLGLIAVLTAVFVPFWGAMGGACAYLAGTMAASLSLAITSRRALAKRRAVECGAAVLAAET